MRLGRNLFLQRIWRGDGLRLAVRGEFRAQLAARPVEHYAEIVWGNVHPLANLNGRTLINGIELKCLCDPRRQFADSPFQMRAELAKFEATARGQGFFSDLMNPKQRLVERLVVFARWQRLNPHCTLTAGLPQVIANFVAQDAHEPGALGTAA